MTILVAVKKNGRVFMGADRITTFGNEYATDLVNCSKIIKLKNAYLGTSGYTLLDNVIEHLYNTENPIMQNPFKTRADAFTFFLSFYAELKKNYTLVDTGKDTYANFYNVFLLVTPTSIYGVSNNLSVHEYERFAAKGAGSDYSQGCLYGLYDLIDDGAELARLGLEAACHFSIYCREPIDVIEVKESDFAVPTIGYKAQSEALTTHRTKLGLPDHVVVKKDGNSSYGRGGSIEASSKKSETAIRKVNRKVSSQKNSKSASRKNTR